MPTDVNLEDVISDAVNDSQISDDTPEISDTPEVSDTSDTDTGSDSTGIPESSPENPTSIADVVEETSITAPGAKSNEPQDEFERLAGIQQNGVGGRENRIPYSRVKKITEKAVSDVAEAALGRKLTAGEKAIDVVKAHVAQLPELQSRVTDYESRLNTVGEFERVMASEPQRFLQMLAKVPAYQEFFSFVEQAVAQAEGSTAGPENGQPLPATQAGPVPDEMPQPDEPLADGSMVYSMDGLKNLLAWQAKQVEDRITNQYTAKLKEYENRYNPIESEWKEHKRVQATLPIIRKQIAEAQTWPLFNENQDEITRVLQLDPAISLDAAYRKVVFPKLVAERNSMRKDVLQEIRQAPVSTSMPARAAAKPTTSSGPRSVEEIIKESISTLRR